MMAGKESKLLRIGILGTGYMGNNHARVLSNMPDVVLVGVYDNNIEKASECATRYRMRVYSDVYKLLDNVDAVVIAVPTSHHYSYTKLALERDLDVLVEKPIADTMEHATELSAIARRVGRVLQVGHIERFNPVCFEFPRIVKEPIFISCERLSPYLPEWVGDTGVIIDLMIHDIDIVLSLVKDEVVKVNSVCRSIISDTEDLALAQFVFKGGAISHFACSRICQAKIRRLTITQPKEYICADLLHETITIHHFISSDYYFDRRMGFKQETVTEIPYLSRHGEPLRLELESFIETVRTRGEPVVTGEDATRVLGLAMEVMSACSN